MKISIILTAIFIEIVCKGDKYRLTERENEIRIGSCGDTMDEFLWLASLFKNEDYIRKKEEMEKEKPRKTTPPPETSTIEESTETTTEWTTEEVSSTSETSDDISNSTTELITTTSEISTTTEKYNFPPPTNAVFISQFHLLTSSSWLLVYNSSAWRWKSNQSIVNDSICLHDEKASFHTEDVNFQVLDSRNHWRRAKKVIFLRFCEFKESQEGFLSMIVVERDDMPIPVMCLPKVISKVPQPRIQRFQFKYSEEIVEGMGMKCEVNETAHFYTVSDMCQIRRGAPLVQIDSLGIDRLIGVGAIASNEENVMYRFHIIQEYMNEMCEIMGICGREMETIGLDKENEEKALDIIDSDYVEMIQEPDVVELNGQGRKNFILELIVVVWCIWFLK